LITPTDPEEDKETGRQGDKERGQPGDTTGTNTSSVSVSPGLPVSLSCYYQLTHDYLVPALRQWLTRKQRETRRGRTQLLLAERVGLWSAKQESRQLPGWWEWCNMLLFTRKKDWTAPQRQMLRAATRKHFLQASVLAVFLALIGWALLYWQQGPLKAAELVRALASAETLKVPDIIKDLSSCRRWA